MVYFLILPAIIYLIYLLNKSRVWRGQFEMCNSGEDPPLFRGVVSIVLPVYNEIGNVEAVVRSLCAQIDDTVHELIVVNDGSDDGSKEVIEALGKELAFILIDHPKNLGKKEALAEAIDRSAGQVIVTVDADCSHGPSWLASLLSPFESEDGTALVQGMVYSKPGQGFLHYFQFLESIVLHVFSAVDLLSQKAGMGSGANLAYTRSAFDLAGKFSAHRHIKSGDDVFLIRDIKKSHAGRLFPNLAKSAKVETNPQDTVKLLVKQKLRWAGKWRSLGNTHLQLQGLTIFLFNAYFLVSLFVLPFFMIETLSLVFLILGLKLIAELILLWNFCSSMQLPLKILYFLITVLLYPFYAVIFGIASYLQKQK